MAEKILKVRTPQKIDSTENWNLSDLVLLKGELGIEELIDGSTKFKFGDGKNLWKNLPYATGNTLNNILDGISNGSIRTSLSTQESASYKMGNASTALGQGSKASGNFSQAENFNTVASGAYSHAEGRETTASGSSAHAEGTKTTAIGARSHAAGHGTIAKGAEQTAIGRYNIQDDNEKYAFIVGSGTETARKNAFTIDWEGKVEANGKALATEEFVSNNGGKIDTVKVNGENVEIVDKAVDITVPTKTSQLTNDSNFLTQHQDISGKANLDQVVRHDVAQDLSEEQKTQARTNIGASNFDGQYSSLSGAPTIPSKTSELTNDSNYITNEALKNLATKATTLAGYGISDAYTKGETDLEIQTEINKLNKADTAIEGKYVSAVSETNGVISVIRENLPVSTDYTVTVTEATVDGYAKAYTIAQSATGLNTTINIPKDMVVESGTVEKYEQAGAWGEAGTYLVLTLANAANDKIYINAGSLIEYVTSGSTEADSVQVVIDSLTHKVTANIKNGSIGKEKLATDVINSMTAVSIKRWEATD